MRTAAGRRRAAENLAQRRAGGGVGTEAAGLHSAEGIQRHRGPETGRLQRRGPGEDDRHGLRGLFRLWEWLCLWFPQNWSAAEFPGWLKS